MSQDKQRKAVGMNWFESHGIVFHDLHALELDNPKPLIRIVSAEEQSAMTVNASASAETEQLWLMCGPCIRSWSRPEPFRRSQLVKHLLDA